MDPQKPPLEVCYT
jgi:hypothetical protein